MVHTYHKLPPPRAKQTYRPATHWKTYTGGLVFVGTLLTAPHPHRTAFSLLVSPSVAWPFGLWWGLETEHEGEVKDKRVRVFRSQVCSGSASLPAPISHSLVARTGRLKECFLRNCRGRKAAHSSQHMTNIH